MKWSANLSGSCVSYGNGNETHGRHEKTTGKLAQKEETALDAQGDESLGNRQTV